MGTVRTDSDNHLIDKLPKIVEISHGTEMKRVQPSYVLGPRTRDPGPFAIFLPVATLSSGGHRPLLSANRKLSESPLIRNCLKWRNIAITLKTPQ